MAEARGALDGLVERFLAHHQHFFPVDATFMGLADGHDRLPPADAETLSRERAALDALASELERVGEPAAGTLALEWRMLHAALTQARLANEHRPRLRQPTWYTGEAAFGLIALLLPSAPAGSQPAIAARLAAMPAFLEQGMRNLAGKATPADWVARARREIAALERLLDDGLPLHPAWRAEWHALVDAAKAALERFAAAIAALPPGEPACGRDYLATLMRDVHGLDCSPAEALARAEDAFARLGDKLSDAARCVDPERGADAQLAALADLAPDDDRVVETYREWHARAMDAARALVTPATEYGLEFRHHPDWAQAAIGELYFLAYRSPPAIGAGAGSIYWVPAPGVDRPAYRRAQNLAAIKQVHAVHHGSIGHHTQNARARVAGSRLARLAGTDCASGVAFLAAGTMVEGWSSYVMELMEEVDGFYSPAEKLALIHGERRNAASVIADIKLHSGEWSLERMRAFYRDEAGFPASRVWSETTRNSIFPATRLMYFLGTELIKALRRELAMETRAFHDALIACGHVPIAWAGEAIRRDSRLASKP